MSEGDTTEEDLLRSVVLQNAKSIHLARLRAEEELLAAKEALERRSEELAHSLAMMRATLESTTDGILVTDSAGKITDFNEKFVLMWHIPPRLMETADHRRLLDEISSQFDDPAAHLARVEAVYATSPPESYDRLEIADGRVYERFSKIQFIKDRNVGRVWSFRDVTERRQAEEALRDETRVLELLNETGKAVASTLDLQKLIQVVTDAGTELSGAKFGAFFYVGKDDKGEALLLYTLSGAPRSAFESFGHPRPTALFGPTFRGEGPIRCDDVLVDPRYGTMEPHFGMPKGHLPVRSYLAVSVISRTGEVLGGLFFGHPEPGIFTARTERVIVGLAAQAAVAIDNARLYDDVKRAADERKTLLEAEKSAREEAERVSLIKDEFLATLSHELRTPLNAILGWSEILLLAPHESEDLNQGLESIARNARAQTQLIEDLLDMSRIVSGKVRLEVQRVDLGVVVDAAIAAVLPSADAKGIRLRKIVDPLAGPVSGDPNRLQQVIWNLLSNAVKFTPKNGKIEILVERVNSHIEITVNDSGEGISPAFLPHVFERFKQADSSITRKHGGLGLGLSIVKQLVELHGGSVRVKSAGEGQGATFIVSLLLAPIREGEGQKREHPSTVKPPEAGHNEVDLAGLRVLVIDDEADARDLIRRVLKRWNADVVAAGSADEGLKLLQIERPDLIVSDIGMPDKDGYQFIREVRNLAAEKGGQTPAVALTAFARSEDRTRAMIAGYQVHVSKPVEPLELVATVASLARTAKKL